MSLARSSSSCEGSEQTLHTLTMSPDMSNSRYPADIEKQVVGDKLAAERSFTGSGTVDDPYVVDWDLHDEDDPYNWPKSQKWLITAQLALCTFTVSFGSSAYTGGMLYTMEDFGISDNVAILGISLYVLGFALGPLIFASMGEMYGRRPVFLVTGFLYSVFQLQGALSRNVATLLSCRLLTGIFGASPLTNAGGTISDIFNFRERGLASAIYATVPFLGPVIGPIVGGFVAENPRLGWHFNFWLMFIFSVVSLIGGYFFTPETYAPVLLRQRARGLSSASNGGAHFVSLHDLKEPKSLSLVLKRNLSRPFVFIVREPIVLAAAVYASIMYGTLYALFSGFPIIFQQHRGFTPGQSGLAFVGVGLGIMLGTASQTIQNKIYWGIMQKSESGRAPPEARLHMAILGSFLSPIGLWWFAWTSMPSIHWSVCIVAGIPFGIGIAQILQSLTTYLMDTYTIYFASAISATVVLRSICGAAFPLFSGPLFRAFGDQWAMSFFACFATACLPIPLLFWRYGPWIRSRSMFAYKEGPPASFSRSTTTAFSARTDSTVCHSMQEQQQQQQQKGSSSIVGLPVSAKAARSITVPGDINGDAGTMELGAERPEMLGANEGGVVTSCAVASNLGVAPSSEGTCETLRPLETVLECGEEQEGVDEVLRSSETAR